MISQLLTNHLLHLDEESLRSATEHDFLRAAGQRTLSKPALERWLTQDRLYALCGYTKFMGHMLARLGPVELRPQDPESQAFRRRLRVIVDATANIEREITFFEDTAQANGLDLGSYPRESSRLLGLANPTTRGYIDYMTSLAASGSYAEALVCLWAMEVMYYRAWCYVKAQEPREDGDAQVRGALDALIPNWTSSEFKEFVDSVAELVDELPEADRQGEGLERLERVWKTVLWFEERFWYGE